MTATKEQLNDLAAEQVTLAISELASDRKAIKHIVEDHFDTVEMTTDEVRDLCARLEAAIRRHLPTR